MKKLKLFLMPVLILAVAMSSLAGCSPKEDPPPAAVDPVDMPFTPSYGLSEGGFWLGISALDYVVLPDYRNIKVPDSVHLIPDTVVQAELEKMLADYVSVKIVTDRSIRDGDTVNIDYVGSLGGTEFSGGSTGGMGTDVTIGATNYIDGFLEQLVGRNPGESFDIEVRFPDDYGNEELDGQDAVFAITVNYILETELPELTDDFVAGVLFDQYGYTTVSELTGFIREGMSRTAVALFLEQWLLGETEVKSVPPLLIEYQEKSLIDYYQGYASQQDMEITEFLNLYLGVPSGDALLELSRARNTATATLCLVLQAVAEDAGLTVEEADIVDYFLRYVGTEDYHEYKDYYGLPYIKLIVLQQKVLDFVVDHATLE